MSKIVVVGANHAGTAAVKTLLGNYADKHEVVVYDRNNNISFLGCGMALWIGNQISKPDGLFYADKASLEAMGAKVTMEAEVYKVDYDQKKVFVKLNDGTEVEESYDKLILATGSLPIIPNIPGKDLENVQQVKLYQNAAEVIEKIKNPEIKNITVVGAGYIGVELAEAFERHGKNVTMIDIADTCLPAYYDEPFTSMMKENLAKHNINLEFGQMVKELKGKDGKVCTVVTDKKEIPAEMVILSIGFRPNNALGKESLELFRNGSYLVNKKQETSMKDVYAIGDCATVYDNAIDNTNYIALATNAVRSGIVAAHNAAGTEIESIGVQGSNGICIYDLKMVSTGITVGKAEKLGIEVEYTDFEDTQKPGFIETTNPDVKLRIVYDKKTRVVLGAQMASEYDMSMGIHMFSLAIQEKVTIDRIALLDIFFLPHFNQPYNYITMAALGAK
ncbi:MULTISPECIES: H2O-forming NADH oxidase [Peptostreptococcus]|jgi:NADPH-dependent 2,4-dienoyl-CoA reductase/sulfur reductase-like enzyme|uniref:NADH oxidase n=4 Tax=Peptostreptococcus TaxID=1257 RepID=D3MU33_9FIRM|nr:MULTISPECIES: FAD-dependent oxidoreductase [Peptostreptococcus]EFD04320.1 NADH oxidase [Peptostreptococcus anaerobius 653-L]KXB70395.1 NADH oxidase [Peptostreptococcus anaerobius]KXI10477.1 NADH oxidase [Peptostreptococcus anaerobius]MCB6983719.1 FAD-dependent oxidoreductase [Peptostreptococcus anaerobius]MCQ5151591.1 FAD-dependent oxidoreductase [Peptostreptococcus anaerobius]